MVKMMKKAQESCPTFKIRRHGKRKRKTSFSIEGGETRSVMAKFQTKEGREATKNDGRKVRKDKKYTGKEESVRGGFPCKDFPNREGPYKSVVRDSEQKRKGRLSPHQNVYPSLAEGEGKKGFALSRGQRTNTSSRSGEGKGSDATLKCKCAYGSSQIKYHADSNSGCSVKKGWETGEKGAGMI